MRLLKEYRALIAIVIIFLAVVGASWAIVPVMFAPEKESPKANQSSIGQTAARVIAELRKEDETTPKGALLHAMADYQETLAVHGKNPSPVSEECWRVYSEWNAQRLSKR
jgi:hypothetical protein